jgi:integrase
MSNNRKECQIMPKKKGNGEGSIRERGKSLEVRWEKEGNSHSKSYPNTPEGKAEAKKFMKSLSSVSTQYCPQLTLAAWADQWYKALATDVEKHKLEESTYVGYQYTLKLIKAQWGELPLTEITVADIEDGIDQIKKPDGGKYAFQVYQKVKVMLGQIFNRAESVGKIQRGHNPMDLVLKLRNTVREKPKKEVYTADEFYKLYNELPYDRYGHAIRLCLACGLRSQELLPLRDTDIEPDGSVISVDKAVKIGEKGRTYEAETKTPTSDRLIHVPEFAQPSALYLRRNAVNGYILPNGQGRYIYPTTWRKWYTQAVESVGVDALTPHKMRSTYVTNMDMKAGVAHNVLQTMTGHADLKTMLGYDHPQNDDKATAATKYNTWFNSLSENKDGKDDK